jgi:histone-lysine N-methyltransferase SUV420H
VAVAEEKLLATGGLRRFYNSLRSAKEKEDFRNHMRRYMSIYLPDCPFEISSTNRYTIVTHEASVTARRDIRRNETIKYLSGIQVVITPEEEKEMALRKKDFSIVVSSRNKCASLFMGPARMANHDCDANARLVTRGQAAIEIIACRDIAVGDEITVSYSDNYFGEDNCECLCDTCEKTQRNGWESAEGNVSLTKSIEEDLIAAAQGYSLRRRRRDDSVCRGSERTPSVTPDVRPRVPRSRQSQKMQGDLASTAPPDEPEPLSKRKRQLQDLTTPPITPAKRQKTSKYEVISVHGESSRGSSTSDLGRSPVSSEGSHSDAALTDVTSPGEESPEPAILSPKRTPKNRSMGVLKIEEGSYELQVQLVARRIPSIEISALTISTDDEPDSEVSSARQVDLTANVRGLARRTTMEMVTTVEDTGDLEERRTRGRPLKAKLAVSCSNLTIDTAESERSRSESCSPPPTPKKQRVPGDYTLTPLLLSEPEMAWILCTICSTAFVQQNAYYTRSSCPRCERHSKLYGYMWPKTERSGRDDREERILDHRIVHRFLNPLDEAKVRGRTSWKDTQDRLRAKADEERAKALEAKRRKSAKIINAHDLDSFGLRRSGRVRTASLKVMPK